MAIEVAFPSLRKDRLIKAPLYAQSGVAEYWIVDAKAQAIEVFRDSDGKAYGSESRYGLDATVSPVAFPDVAIRVADVFLKEEHTVSLRTTRTYFAVRVFQRGGSRNSSECRISELI